MRLKMQTQAQYIQYDTMQYGTLQYTYTWNTISHIQKQYRSNTTPYAQITIVGVPVPERIAFGTTPDTYAGDVGR